MLLSFVGSGALMIGHLIKHWVTFQKITDSTRTFQNIQIHSKTFNKKHKLINHRQLSPSQPALCCHFFKCLPLSSVSSSYLANCQSTPADP